ncbi:MAG TPA: hypothetical protein VD903_04170 [Pseudonocardia sp.]|nr:hypothetical protein [Pseudonocardia sp.]
MSSLARRSLRTTAAVAGIAAAGVGLAAPAVAAPQPQDGPGTDSGTPATDTAPSPDVIGELPDTAELPQLFTFEGPRIYTAGQSGSELPTADDLPPAPSVEDLVNIGGREQLDGVEVQTAAPQDEGDSTQDQGDATEGLGAASMLGELAAGPLGATQGNTIGE